MIKIAICDDDINQQNAITLIIDNFYKSTNNNYEICAFNNGEQLLLSHKKYDIYFLDIKMDKLNGIDVARRIRLVNEKAIIIFITGFKDYVFDAFDVEAFHYLLKPVNEDKLNEILHSIMIKFQKKDKFIIVKTNKQSNKIHLNDILYIESNQRKLKVHTTYDIIEYYYKLSDIEQELCNDNFFKCHKSYIVNLKHVQSYDSVSVTLKNSEKIYLSKHRLADFSKAFMYYLRDEEL